jgi:hypothetical protein
MMVRSAPRWPAEVRGSAPRTGLTSRSYSSRQAGETGACTAIDAAPRVVSVSLDFGASNQVMVDLEAVGVRSYIAEPDRGRRRWTEHPEARAAVYRNRRRIRGGRGRRLLRQRGE